MDATLFVPPLNILGTFTYVFKMNLATSNVIKVRKYMIRFNQSTSFLIL